VSAVYKALILNKPDIVKYLIQEQNKISPGQYTGNVHLFNCLVNIRHAGVTTDSRDDVVVTDRSVWCMNEEGDVWRTICWGDCDVLRHLLCVGLDVNQSIHLYDRYSDSKSDVRPLLYSLIDEEEVEDVWYVNDRIDWVRLLLGAGVDVNVRVRYREYVSVLDREGVSVLERKRRRVGVYCDEDSDESVLDRVRYRDITRRRVCQDRDSRYERYKVPRYNSEMNEIKKYVRRYSV
jgi:hypothetical protein